MEMRKIMHFQQYYLGCLAHASYLIGDPSSGRAVIVDPQRDVDQYVADCEKLGLEITDVFLTHFHADFVAGHGQRADRAERNGRRRREDQAEAEGQSGSDEGSR